MTDQERNDTVADPAGQDDAIPNPIGQVDAGPDATGQDDAVPDSVGQDDAAPNPIGQESPISNPIEHHDAPKHKHNYSHFGLGKVGIAIIAVLVVALVAWRVGYTPNVTYLSRDVGGFAGSSDYGGGYDWGGSSSYDWDWGGSSSYDYDYDYDWDWDWGDSGYSSSYSYYDDDEFDSFDLIVAIIVAGIIFVKVFRPLDILPRGSRHSKHGGKSQPAGASRTSDSQLKSISKLQQRDPQFSAAAVEETIANVYVQMQHAWTAGDFEPMRPYFSNTLFSQFSNQLASLTKKGRTNYVDDITVLETKVRGWYESSGYEYLVMKVRTRITDYTLDRDGNVVGGRRNVELFMEYEYTLGRTKGTKTTAQAKQTQAGECPNCGAPINLAQSAKCAYCGSVIESNRFTWVITAIKGVSQQTAH